MRSLREIDPDMMMEVSEDIGHAIKAWRAGSASPDQQRLAYRYVVHTAAGVHRLSSAMPDDAGVMAWFQGRRFVGLQIETIAETPIVTAEAAEPVPRTMTERAMRRQRGKR